jgi:hypothetical protein
VPEPEERSPLDLLCDLLVYVPVGFAFEAPKLLPELATKGRDQVAAARSVGQLVVRQAGTRLGPIVGSLLNGVLANLARDETGETPADTGETLGDGATAAPAAAGREVTAESAGSEEPIVVGDGHGALPPAQVPAVDTLPIPHYDSLAASQVVPRLAALSGEEVAAVRAYESAHRARRTIMNRTEHLLGPARERA